MRALLALSVIFWSGVAKPAAQPLNRAFCGDTLFITTFSSLNSKSAFLFDTIPAGAPGKYILTPKVTKLYDVIFFAIPATEVPVETDPVPSIEANATAKGKPLLKVSGNVLYDAYYRSRIDTPYAVNDVYQHTIQTRLDLLYKDRYPLKIYFTSRFNNAPLFRNYTDFNMKFNPADFKRIAKRRLMESAERWLAEKAGNPDSLYQLMEAKKRAIFSLRQSIKNPGINQKLVEDREKEFYSKRPLNTFLNTNDLEKTTIDSPRSAWNDKDPDTTNNRGDGIRNKADTLIAKFNDYRNGIETNKKMIDSLENDLRKLEDQYRKIKRMVNEILLT